MSTSATASSPEALRRQLAELRSINELQGGAAAERCAELARTARSVDPSLACQALQLAYWGFMVRSLPAKASAALERSAVIARRHGLRALQARCVLMRIEMRMAQGEHHDGFGALVELVRSPQFRDLSVNDGVRAAFLLAWGCRLLDPGSGVETCLALVDERLRAHAAPLAPWFVLMRAKLDLQRLAWARPAFSTLLAGRVTEDRLLQASRRRLQADCRHLLALDDALPENRSPLRSGRIIDALRQALEGRSAAAGKAAALLAAQARDEALGSKSHVDLGYLVAAVLLGTGRPDLAARQMDAIRADAQASDMWEMRLLWPHLESVLSETLGLPTRALTHYQDHATAYARQVPRLNTAAGRLLASITEAPPDATSPPGGTEPEYLRRATALLSADTQRMGMTELASAVGVSDRALRDAFRTYLNTSPAEYARRARLDAARKLVRAGVLQQRSVAELAEQFGFSNPGRFSAAYRARFGVAPTAEPQG